MAKTIKELAGQAVREELRRAYGEPTADFSEEQQYKTYRETETLLRNLMGLERSDKRVPKISLSEAVFASDFKLLFPKVVQQVLTRPQEPIFLGQSLLARTVQVDDAKIMQFPSFGAIQAFGPLNDSQDYPEQDMAFTTNATEIRTQRFGLRIAISEEVIKDSQWDILALHIEAAGNALKRLKEQKIFAEYEARAVTVFDNEVAGKQTSGKGADGVTNNGTFSHMDLLDMMANLGANSYVPTDIILHPMAWSVWQKDPVLRYQLLERGGIGSNLSNIQISKLDDRQYIAPQYVPFGLNVVVSPFQKMEYGKTLSGSLSGQAAANVTSITVVDRDSSILVLQKSPVQIAQWDDPIRDIVAMRFKEEYGLALLNGGRSAVIAKNIRLDDNEAPVYTIKTVSV